MMSVVLVSVCKMVQSRVIFYKAVVQAVLLYGSGIWVVKYVMMKVM